MASRKPRHSNRLVANSILLAAVVTTTGLLSHLATINHADRNWNSPALLATLATLIGVIPPLGLSRLIAKGAHKQLVVVGWRLAIMLPALAIAVRLEGDQRKYYLLTLLVCYFVALPLESWLLIRDIRLKN